MEQRGDQNGMAETTDRKEFGDALDDGKQDGLKKSHGAPFGDRKNLLRRPALACDGPQVPSRPIRHLMCDSFAA
ncbi:hypothetical protein AA0498_1107 [Acidomonas methanolica]|uniref:Uncharacterized protein n=1 Tax=Acidomonas methanolica NBRC 104435 TaxID=1231351 RepID=A0A023D6C5_ACIMT|nr:hypothetical protein Amme_060_007 [Acidomonas methanolica NBRC 104435]GBQ49960.1 hypothetical protein AA0498_1107 [Acidomonas methanolica]GEK97584.1 hypothetical protein AME01nite_00830 [Acidomonas methanolica NBRC 104435]